MIEAVLKDAEFVDNTGQDGELHVEIELRSKEGYLLKGKNAIRHKW